MTYAVAFRAFMQGVSNRGVCFMLDGNIVARSGEEPEMRSFAYRRRRRRRPRHRRRISLLSVAPAPTSRASVFATNATSMMVIEFSLFCPPYTACRKRGQSRHCQYSGKGREAPATVGEAAQAPARKRTALDAVRRRLNTSYDHAKGGNGGEPLTISDRS